MIRFITIVYSMLYNITAVVFGITIIIQVNEKFHKSHKKDKKQDKDNTVYRMIHQALDV